MYSNKYELGMKKFSDIHGALGAQQTVDSLKSISKELAGYSIEWVFGDLYAGDIIDMRTREICNISALVATEKLPQLKNHIQSAYKLGITKKEIEKIILNAVIIVGFPAVVNAMFMFKEVFDELESDK